MSWSPWYILKDKTSHTGFVVKRSNRAGGKTKWQNLPAKEYKHLPLVEVEALLRRLNASHESAKLQAEARYNFDHAFISVKVQERFSEYLQASSNSERHVGTMVNYLKTYALEYFVIEKKLPDPKAWKTVQDKWGLWLEGQGLSYNSIVQIIFNTNRFLKFLAEVAYPGEVPFIKLQPLSKNKLKALKLKTYDNRYKFISPELFKKIEQKISHSNPELLPSIRICYNFGARISESLGFEPDDVYEDMLEVKRQAKAFTKGRVVTKSLKGLESRQVPYWFAKPEQAYEWISKLPKMSPQTLNRKVNDALRPFGHESHDFRRSFVTRALRLHHWRDVMVAAGHKDMETTLRYDQPEAKTERKKFKPSL